MAVLGTMVNSFGGRWFNEEWEPQLDSPAWSEAINFYVDMMGKHGLLGATSNGFNENLALFFSGKCGMWVDATSAAGKLYNPKESSWLTSWASRRRRSPRRRRARIGCGPGHWPFLSLPSPRMPPRPSSPGPHPRNT